MAVDLTGTVAGGEFRAGRPKPLFTSGQIGNRNYDVLPGGRRFLVNQIGGEFSGSSALMVILNWQSGLAR